MKQVLQRYRWLMALFSVIILLVILSKIWLYQQESESLRYAVYDAHKQDIHTQVNALISEQKSSALALALMLAENPNVQQLLSLPCCEFSAGLATTAQRIQAKTPSNDIWLQVINRDGISMERSWTVRRGDSLIGIRTDLEYLINNPHEAPTTTVSTGLFSMTFKSMVQVLEGSKVLGVVEVVSQFQPLIDRLNIENTRSLVLADKRHRPKLILPSNDQFIDDYYVVNSHAADELVELVTLIGMENLLSDEIFIYKDQLAITWVPIFDAFGEVEGHWLVAKTLDSTNFNDMNALLNRYLIVSIVVVVMLVLLAFIFLSRQQITLQRNYFRDVIDSASDILYVTDMTRTLDANKHFFDFFSEFDDLQAFHQRYQSVCDTFEPGEGLLQPEINGIFWIQHVLNHPADSHVAKIMKAGRAYYFAVKIQPLTEALFGQFTVAMHDITELVETQQQLAHLSQTDELTGVSNRLFFNKVLSQELTRFRRYQTPMCLLMLDVDYFKIINDENGHDVGDAVLQELAKLIQSGLRSSDLLCRYGGEEFVIMLLETDMDIAKDITERLHVMVASHEFQAIPGLSLTCSFGLTCFQLNDTENSVLKRADQALYEAKNAGRNQVKYA
ncbi:MAG: GGDEF domain-containing protein [Thiomicrospira sp.]|uniref:GGDEF domain-containing protein n=1 Tax=Thiomicrospira sp. TaxID=935 RepID=UPI0019E6D353|nr:GGDEF domain-containing protein [Thiomicrospira sp.]MBE0493180.1 GGDEF domain-containing protein [Thiomicrospira sp.]